MQYLFHTARLSDTDMIPRGKYSPLTAPVHCHQAWIISCFNILNLIMTALRSYSPYRQKYQPVTSDCNSLLTYRRSSLSGYSHKVIGCFILVLVGISTFTGAMLNQYMLRPRHVSNTLGEDTKQYGNHHLIFWADVQASSKLVVKPFFYNRTFALAPSHQSNSAWESRFPCNALIVEPRI